jgi:hypothetical protein
MSSPRVSRRPDFTAPAPVESITPARKIVDDSGESEAILPGGMVALSRAGKRASAIEKRGRAGRV